MLPSIKESTELQSLNNQPLTSNGAKNFNYSRVTQWKSSLPKSAIEANPFPNKNLYKFDPTLMKKTEQLMNSVKAVQSLDNTHLTITSLNYIDEYQTTINGNLQNIYMKRDEDQK
jgi:solute carrier family 20 (sodium-dependent phosphate transporter)